MKKVHLIGKGPGFLDAPALSEEYEVWGLNDVRLYKEVDILFNMHYLNTIDSPNKICLIVAEQDNIPLYTIRKYDWLSNSISYPLDEIVEKHGHKYFSSSICYMIALAIHLKVTDLDLWGVCFHSNHKDIWQRSGVEYWLGVATGKGINITIHGESALLQVGADNQLYGYEEEINYINDFVADFNSYYKPKTPIQHPQLNKEKNEYEITLEEFDKLKANQFRSTKQNNTVK